MKTLKPNYIIIPLITVFVALIGSYFTTKGMVWYDTTLTQPELTPPKWLFPVAWNTIFALATASALIVWNKYDEKNFFATLHDLLFDREAPLRHRWIIRLFVLNAFLNVFWSYLFFANQLIAPALLEMILLEITNIALIILIWKESKLASIFLWPYAIWVAFATYLTYQILLLN